MHFKFRNVNGAFQRLVHIFHDPDQGYGSMISRSTSRNGDVLYIQEPVIVTYTHPRERVLFNQARDANPFFHLYEALWMLAGRNDVAPLAYYNSNIANYSDDGKTFNGAYGYRWRCAQAIEVYEYSEPDGKGGVVAGVTGKPVDQLRTIIDHLKAVPDSRRAVLQMWNVEDDLLKIETTKDNACNTHVYFAIRKEFRAVSGWVPFLDMTVCNRSNDLIWGLLGANAVHFSFLQEYMAACIGCEVGVYNQITNNCHVYLNDKWQPEKWLADTITNWYEHGVWHEHGVLNPGRNYPTDIRPFPLVKDPATFDRECAEFVERHKQDAMGGSYTEPFLKHVAQPVCVAFHYHKRRSYSYALECVSWIEADDWRIACTNWLLKRKERYENQPGTTPNPATFSGE